MKRDGRNETAEAEREARLAAALRDNLKRRKAAQRERKPEAAASDADADKAGGGEETD